MHRFYVPPEQTNSDPLVLAGSEAHHASHVLRLRPGEKVEVLNGTGTVFHCVVQELNRSSASLTVTERREIPPRRFSITLCQAIPKGKLIESIIQKATELGVSRVVPLFTERVVVKLDNNEAEDKKAKWQAVAVEAVKQCGSPWLPVVEKPCSIDEAQRVVASTTLQLVGSLRPSALHPHNYFEGARPKLMTSSGQDPAVAVWVGPEGDFTSAELDVLEAKGALPMTMGPLVLRSETAAIYALSIINYELQQLQG